MNIVDSKKLWLELHNTIPDKRISLGKATSAAYRTDPKMIAFISSRYKFVAKMLNGIGSALEVGCGDAFGSPIVAQSVQHLYCTDIDSITLQDNAERLQCFKNINFEYHDFREVSFNHSVDAVYAVDVLEHFFPEEEEKILKNVLHSLNSQGIAIWGTPNILSEQYASQYSRMGHINLKSFESLQQTFQKYFQHVFIFSMNDEVLHTGYHKMAHYLWALCVTPRT